MYNNEKQSIQQNIDDMKLKSLKTLGALTAEGDFSGDIKSETENNHCNKVFQCNRTHI